MKVFVIFQIALGLLLAVNASPLQAKTGTLENPDGEKNFIGILEIIKCLIIILTEVLF